MGFFTLFYATQTAMASRMELQLTDRFDSKVFSGVEVGSRSLEAETASPPNRPTAGVTTVAFWGNPR